MDNSFRAFNAETCDSLEGEVLPADLLDLAAPCPPRTGVELTYGGQIYGCRTGETALDALLRQGADITFSCRNGICQGCIQRATSGAIPKDWQKGLKPNLAAKNYFLPCIARPEQALAVSPPEPSDFSFTAMVTAREQMAKDTYRILLEPFQQVAYRPGQFVNLRHPGGELRSYSLASQCDEDPYLELHVRRVAGGLMSTWLIDELAVEGEVEFLGPFGACTYAPDQSNANLLLVATGTGLAPLMGIVRSALAAGHEGDIHLYHGSSVADGLYLIDDLRELEQRHANFHYVPCISSQPDFPGFRPGRAHDLAFADHPNLTGWQVYLAGNANMVADATGLAIKAGTAANAILADPFTPQPRPAHAAVAPDDKTFPPDPEMWEALREGEVMNAILTDFYTRVFDDPVLSPYFQGVTRQRLIEKVYSFMRQTFTGERAYFGNRPRNAHNWMIIPDDVFDYRESLMTECMRRQGLAEHLIARWNAVEESFRGDIVKSEPFARTIDGIEIPVSGFGKTRLEVGAVCDGCEDILENGNIVHYHLRTGEMYCDNCSNIRRNSPI